MHSCEIIMYAFINTLNITVVTWSYAIASHAEVDSLFLVKHLKEPYL